jgi:transcriptional regulator with XRE-family HTH domain
MRSKTLQRVLDNTPKDVEIFVEKYAALVLRVNQLLKEKQYTQKKLAEKLDKKPSEIHRWLNGEHNFTLRSVAKLEAELGEQLLVVPERKTATDFQRYYGKASIVQTVTKSTSEKSSDKGEWTPCKPLTIMKNVG